MGRSSSELDKNKTAEDDGKIGALAITVANGSSEQLSSALDFIGQELNLDGLVEIHIDAEYNAAGGDLQFEVQVESETNSAVGKTFKPLAVFVTDMSRTTVEGDDGKDYVQNIAQLRLTGNGSGNIKILASYASNVNAACVIYTKFYRI